MTAQEITEWLKSYIESPVWSRGSIDGTHEKAIALYEIPADSYRATVGVLSSYRTRNFSILIHWTKNYDEAEAKAVEVFNYLKTQTQETNGAFIQLRYDAPIPVGKDENKIFEFTVEFKLLIKEK